MMWPSGFTVGHTNEEHAEPRMVIYCGFIMSPGGARGVAALLFRGTELLSYGEQALTPSQRHMIARELVLRADYQDRAPSVRADKYSKIPHRIFPDA